MAAGMSKKGVAASRRGSIYEMAAEVNGDSRKMGLLVAPLRKWDRKLKTATAVLSMGERGSGLGCSFWVDLGQCRKQIPILPATTN